MKNSRGFTLAEVLITLGIIGIVAALTIPNLLQSYRKKVVESRLEHSYAQMSQVFRMAEVDHGEMANWISELNTSTNTTLSTAEMLPFIKTYMMPYLKGAVLNEDKPTLAKIGFPNGIKNPDGSVLFSATSKPYSIMLDNGTIMFFTLRSLTDNNVTKYAGMNIYISLKGANPKATFGKDVFSFYLNFLTNRFGTETCATYKKAAFPQLVCYHTENRENVLERCKDIKYTYVCTALIMMNGWQIPSDYPYKL